MTCIVESCDNSGTYCRGMCNKHYKRWYKWGDPHRATAYTKRGAPLEFLTTQALAAEGEACVLWPYGRQSKGYPMVLFEGKHQTAGGVVLELRGLKRPSSQYHALHSCDTPMCIAWWHLRWGTQRENTQDMRERSGARNQYGPWS